MLHILHTSQQPIHGPEVAQGGLGANFNSALAWQQVANMLVPAVQGLVSSRFCLLLSPCKFTVDNLMHIHLYDTWIHVCM